MSHTIRAQNECCPFLSQKLRALFPDSKTDRKSSEEKTSSASLRAFATLKSSGASLINGVAYTVTTTAEITSKILATTYKILTINGIITPSRVAKSLFTTIKTVWAVVWPVFDLGLSFIPGYSQTKALIKAIPSIFILAASSFVGYRAWLLIENTGLGETLANTATYAYNSPLGEAARNAAAAAGTAAVSTMKQAGRYAFETGTEYIPKVFTWLHS